MFHDILIEFVPLALLLVGCAVLILLHLINRPRRSQLIACDYVVFEAEPVNFENIAADLTANGWHLAYSEGTTTNAILYRFEKKSPNATCLSDIYYSSGIMPRTENRTNGADSIIKISSYGSVK